MLTGGLIVLYRTVGGEKVAVFLYSTEDDLRVAFGNKTGCTVGGNNFYGCVFFSTFDANERE